MNDFGAIDLTSGDDFGAIDIGGPSYETPEVGAFEAGLRGLAQGATMGFSDEIQGGVAAAWEKIKGGQRTYQQLRDEARAKEAAAQEQSPVAYGAGELGGSVGSMLVPGLGVAKGGLAAIAAKEAARGAATGAGYAEEIKDIPEEAAKSAALNALMGGGGMAVGKGIQKLANAPATTKMRNELATRAIGMIDNIPTEQVKRAVGSMTEEVSPLTLATRSTEDIAMKLEKIGAQKTKEALETGSATGFIDSATSKRIAELAKKKAEKTDPTLATVAGGIGGLMFGGADAGLIGAGLGMLSKKGVLDRGPQIGTAAINTLLKAKNLSPSTRQALSRAMVMTPQAINSTLYGLSQTDPILREELAKIQGQSLEE